MIKKSSTVLHRILRSIVLGAGFIAVVALLTIGIGLLDLYNDKTALAEYWQGRSNIPGDFTLVIIGDSIAQGLGASTPDKSLVGLLTTRIEQTTGKSVRVVNLSRSGATVDDALRQQIPKLAQHPQADLVLLEIGANNMRNYDPDSFTDSYEQLLQALPPGKSIAVDIPTFSGHPNLTRQAREANKVVYKLAEDYRVPVAPVFSRIEQHLATTPWIWINASDLFHPNDRGYHLWYESVWPIILDTKLKK